MRQKRLWILDLHINSRPIQSCRKSSQRWRRWDIHCYWCPTQDEEDQLQKVWERFKNFIQWSEDALRPKQTRKDHSPKYRAEQRIHSRHITKSRRSESPTTTNEQTRTSLQLSRQAKRWSTRKICFRFIWRKRLGGWSPKKWANTITMEVETRPMLFRLSIQSHPKIGGQGSKPTRINR